MGKKEDLMGAHFTWQQAAELVPDIGSSAIKLPFTFGNEQVYLKRVTISAFVNNTTQSTAHGISGLGVDDVLLFWAVGENDTEAILIPWAHTTATNSIRCYVTSTNFVMVSQGNYSTYAGYAYIVYKA